MQCACIAKLYSSSMRDSILPIDHKGFIPIRPVLLSSHLAITEPNHGRWRLDSLKRDFDVA